MPRPDRRAPDALRPYAMQRHFQRYPAGSVLIEMGATRVSCAASVEDRVPFFQRGTGEGWIAAEYSLLPSATSTRTQREAVRGRQNGRTQEIQRLIGRALRSVVDMKALGERTIQIDCDVIQADGGTRCASITGGMVALEIAVQKLLKEKVISENPIVHRVAAVSVGVCKGTPTLDLDYVHDSTAEVDLNVVMTDDGRFVELQGCAEHNPFTADHLETMLALARKGLKRIFKLIPRI